MCQQRVLLMCPLRDSGWQRLHLDMCWWDTAAVKKEGGVNSSLLLKLPPGRTHALWVSSAWATHMTLLTPEEVGTWNPTQCLESRSALKGTALMMTTAVPSVVGMIFAFLSSNICRQILYQLKHQESLRIMEWAAYPFSKGLFPTQELNQGLLHCRQLLYQLSYQGSLYWYFRVT